ncbi:aminoglycoside phosphotransferase family protein [Chitinimonas koreensis]|uniref:aminoglycoside phosphotransferase family protein n=1 Tax=Chitinimonas koreensis TaxID=356302 RepID=UPI000401FFA4|nr:phosphotransferase [Chitinimonas koreensis]QNM96991.1 phosphotransferase [Chitinimonas koreensis]
MDRIDALRAWLQGRLETAFTLSEPIGDASSRRYFRVAPAGGGSYVAMDAPPERCDPAPFLRVAALLAPAVRVPAVLAHDAQQGFLLLEDVGETDLQTALAGLDEEAATALYRRAIDALVALQAGVDAAALPDYDAATMADDLERFAEWYADRHLGKPLAGEDRAVWERCRALLVLRAQAQGKVAIHFDYHSRNLTVPAEGGRLGVLDFQDARRGPIGYDLASLLKDMYVSWPEAFRLELAIRYWEAARRAGLPVPAAFDQFYAEFEWMGVFRQIRTLGTFARLVHRDGKPRYLDDMPVALAYLRETCARYAELHPLYKLLNRLHEVQVQVGYTF